ncbi:MAG: hypothetical protein ACOCSI_02315 [Desulfohalobiaceae bacterium]
MESFNPYGIGQNIDVDTHDINIIKGRRATGSPFVEEAVAGDAVLDTKTVENKCGKLKSSGR